MARSSLGRHRAVTLADVAGSAGVSTATASYVLSNRAGVTISAPTRERVIEAAQRLHYRKNTIAAALRSGGLHEIGIYTAVRPAGYLAEIAFACIETAASLGYSGTLQLGRFNEFGGGRFKGAVILGGSGTLDYPDLLQESSIPLVEFGGGAGQCQVHADDFGGARKAVEHLLSIGHRRLAHFAGPQAAPEFQERLRGFLDAVHEAGLSMGASPVAHQLPEMADLIKSDRRPTAVLAHDDESALRIYRCAREAGLSVPNDLSIVGFDDAPFAALVDPPLTTLRIPPELVAGAAFALLGRQFANETVPHQTLVPTSLVVRGSTAPL